METQDKEIWERAGEAVKQIPVSKANFQHIAESGVINGSLLVDLQREVFHQMKLFSANTALLEANQNLKTERDELIQALSGLAKHCFIESDTDFPEYKTATNILIRLKQTS